MDFNDYQTTSRKTAVYPNKDDDFVYITLGLAGEAGEVAEKFKKLIRDHGVYKPSQLTDEQRGEIAKELGDVLWYLTQLSTECGLKLGDIAEQNIEKLTSRLERGKITGNGDNR